MSTALTALVPDGKGAVEWNERKAKDNGGSGRAVKLIIQPEAGIVPIVQAIRKARTAVSICIFRLDRRRDRAGAGRRRCSAVSRVSALIAHTNRGGEGALRKLEQRLLAAGVTVSRTGDDLHALPRQVHGRRQRPARASAST